MVNWADIHPDFAEKVSYYNKTHQQLWEEKGFVYQETKKWIDSGFTPQDLNRILKLKVNFTYEQTQALGLTPLLLKLWEQHELTAKEIKQWINQVSLTDYDFANYLKRKGYNLEQELDLVKLKEEHRKNLNWEDIHKDFAKYIGAWLKKKTYQQSWEKRNIDYQEAKEWIQEKFEPNDYEEVEQWKNLNFTPQEAKSWRGVGLTKKDVEFAAYLRWKGYQPNQDLKKELEKLRKEYNTWKENPPTQEYLDCFYPPEKRREMTKLDIIKKNLTDHLDLSDFINLKELICFGNSLTSLNLSGCVNLVEISCESNQLTELALPDNLINLKALSLSNNNLNQDLSFLSKAVNLEYLDLGNNKFTGSLEYLKEMGELELLNIRDTDLDSGVEYLPESIEKFKCSTNKKEDAKVKAVKDKFGQHFNNKLENYRKWKKDTKHILVRAEDIQKDVSRCFGGYNLEEINQLKDPAQLEKYKKIFYRAKWAGRVAAAASGILSLTNYPVLGGGIAITYPLVEGLVSEWEKHLVEDNESSWERFVNDNKKLWNDYHELRGVLEPCEFFDESSKIIEDLTKLEGEIKDLKKKKNNPKVEFTEEEERKLAEKKIQVKSPFRRKNYVLYSLWKKLKETYPHNLEESTEVTKNQFAQDLWKNWKERKDQWKEIGEILAGTRGVENINLEELKEVIIDIKKDTHQTAQILQSTYGTFPSFSNPNK